MSDFSDEDERNILKQDRVLAPRKHVDGRHANMSAPRSTSGYDCNVLITAPHGYEIDKPYYDRVNQVSNGHPQDFMARRFADELYRQFVHAADALKGNVRMEVGLEVGDLPRFNSKGFNCDLNREWHENPRQKQNCTGSEFIEHVDAWIKQNAYNNRAFVIDAHSFFKFMTADDQRTNQLYRVALIAQPPLNEEVLSNQLQMAKALSTELTQANVRNKVYVGGRENYIIRLADIASKRTGGIKALLIEYNEYSEDQFASYDNKYATSEIQAVARVVVKFVLDKIMFVQK